MCVYCVVWFALQRPKCHVLSPDWWSSTKYARDVHSAQVLTESKCLLFASVFEYDVLLIPVNAGIGGARNHWTLVRVTFETHTIEYFDWLSEHRQFGIAYQQVGNDAMLHVLDFLQDDAAKKTVCFDRSTWKTVIRHDAPQQSGSDDCGVFLCLMVSIMLDDLPIPATNFVRSLIGNFRTRMLLELVSGYLDPTDARRAFEQLQSDAETKAPAVLPETTALNTSSVVVGSVESSNDSSAAVAAVVAPGAVPNLLLESTASKDNLDGSGSAPTLARVGDLLSHGGGDAQVDFKAVVTAPVMSACKRAFVETGDVLETSKAKRSRASQAYPLLASPRIDYTHSEEPHEKIHAKAVSDCAKAVAQASATLALDCVGVDRSVSADGCQDGGFEDDVDLRGDAALGDEENVYDDGDSDENLSDRDSGPVSVDAGNASSPLNDVLSPEPVRPSRHGDRHSSWGKCGSNAHPAFQCTPGKEAVGVPRAMSPYSDSVEPESSTGTPMASTPIVQLEVESVDDLESTDDDAGGSRSDVPLKVLPTKTETSIWHSAPSAAFTQESPTVVVPVTPATPVSGGACAPSHAEDRDAQRYAASHNWWAQFSPPLHVGSVAEIAASYVNKAVAAAAAMDRAYVAPRSLFVSSSGNNHFASPKHRVPSAVKVVDVHVVNSADEVDDVADVPADEPLSGDGYRSKKRKLSAVTAQGLSKDVDYDAPSFSVHADDDGSVSEDGLPQPISEMRDKAKSFVCELCNQSFAQQYSLTRHLRFQQSKCRQNASDENDLPSVSESVNPTQKNMEKPKDASQRIDQFVCAICNNNYMSEKSLRKHQRQLQHF
jgi:hypothetical protein